MRVGTNVHGARDTGREVHRPDVVEEDERTHHAAAGIRQHAAHLEAAEVAAARVDLAHAAGIKTTLIIFGLATSVPLIVAGSAILMALLERYRVLVWGGGALLGWVAGDIMATDPGLVGVFSEATLHTLHVWGGPVGGLIVLGAGYFIVGRHRSLKLDEILAGVALVVWIIVDRISEGVLGANADPLKIWGIRGVLMLLMIGAYILARKQWHVEEQEV